MKRFVLACALCLTSCAPAMVPAPVVTTPRFPEFVQPVVPAEFANGAAAINERRGWAFLQSGDVKTAEHEFAAALKNDPRFFPAEASLGYLELARKDPKASLPHFDKALELDQLRVDVSALFGKGQALLALNRDADALAAFESVLAIDPNQAEARRRVDVLQFRGLEQEIALARESVRAGRLGEASQAYAKAIAGQPTSPFLYRELADVERRQEKTDQALAHYRQAVTLDSTDAHSLEQIGEILESRDDVDGAMRAYTAVAAIEPGPRIDGMLERVRARMTFAKLPEEYRAIEAAPQVTRADLAALIGIRLGPLLQGAQGGDAALLTDVRNSWAQTWILAVARAGVMEPFANHAFQPGAIVRRSDLAEAAARLLVRIGSLRPEAAKSWEAARPRFTDLAPAHLAYPAASVAVAARVMAAAPDGAFEPSRAVTGAEAVDAITKMGSLAGLK